MCLSWVSEFFFGATEICRQRVLSGDFELGDVHSACVKLSECRIGGQALLFLPTIGSGIGLCMIGSIHIYTPT